MYNDEYQLTKFALNSVELQLRRLDLSEFIGRAEVLLKLQMDDESRIRLGTDIRRAKGAQEFLGICENRKEGNP